MCEEIGTSQHPGLAAAVMQTCIVQPAATPLVQDVVSTHQVSSAQTMAIDTESRPPKAALGGVSYPFATSVVAHSSAARAWLSAHGACVAPSLDGHSMISGNKRAHPEAYDVSIEGPRLSFMRRVVQRAASGLGTLSSEQQRQATAMGLATPLVVELEQRRADVPSVRRKVSFDLEIVEVRTYLCPSQPQPERRPYHQWSPTHFPLSSVPPAEVSLAAGDDSSDDGSDVSSVASDTPSLTSHSDESDVAEEGEVVDQLPARAAARHAGGVRRVLGAITCGSAEQMRVQRPESIAFSLRRPSVLSNPFFMSSEGRRDAVCDAYEAWWRRGDASVSAVASEFGVDLAFCWSKHPQATAEGAGRLEAVESMAQLINSGVGVSLTCCASEKRCHTHTVARAVDRRAAKLRKSADDGESVGDVASACDNARVYLVVYAGVRSRPARLAAKLALADPGCVVRELDIANGTDEDVRSVVLQAELLSQVAAHIYTAVFIAIPCSSYAIVRGIQLRSTDEPEGIKPIPPRWRLYMDKHNELSAFGETVAEVCETAGVAWAIENPASRSVKGSPAYWSKFESWGSLWDRPRMQELQRRGAQRYLLPHCAFGSNFQKYIEVMCSAALQVRADVLFAGVICAHAKHADTAVGSDDRGRSKAASTAAYPEDLNVALASLLAVASRTTRRLLHVGSSRPHSDEGQQPDNQRAARWAKPGSLRTLEPEYVGERARVRGIAAHERA